MMKKKYLHFILCVFFFVLFIGCKNDKQKNIEAFSDCLPVKKVKNQDKNLNISIFLDLSDRISPTRNPNKVMEQWKRDLGYLDAVTTAFQNHLRNKKVNQFDDQIRLRLHPIPKDVEHINTMIKKLDKVFTRENANLDEICAIYPDYQEVVETLYQTMLEQKEPAAKKGIDDYPGSDIYGFFKSNVKDYCIKDGYRNILFILTDGYEYYQGNKLMIDKNHKSNYLLSKHLKQWGINADNYVEKLEKDGYGFQVPINGLDNLEIYVIGIAPKHSWELDVINYYWSDWFKTMGVKNFQNDQWRSYLKEAELPANIENAIKEFVYR